MNPGAEIVVMGTDGTVKSGVYEKYAKKRGLKSIPLNNEQQQIVMDTIYNMKIIKLFSPRNSINLSIGLSLKIPKWC